jgi:GMP synthase (glutamine-hydrolysing)
MLIVKTGTTLPEIAGRLGDFEDWIREGLGPGVAVEVCRVDRGEPLPPARRVAGVVVTGSSAMVSAREPWSEATAAWLADAVGRRTPVLGVCFGHQLLAHALGGEVGPNPRGREIGTVAVRLTEAAEDDPLLGGAGAEVAVQATHQEAVLELPRDAVLLGSSALDPHQAFRVGGADAWGVQFHPEFSAEVTLGYIRARAGELAGEGLDAGRLLAEVRETPRAREVLRRFAAVAGS